MRIAICDDDKIILDTVVESISNYFTRRLLNETVETFLDGRELIKAHDSNPYDVIFLDIRMPEFNGFDVARNMNGRVLKTQIVFISSEEEAVFESLQYHPFDFIRKQNVEYIKKKSVEVMDKLMNFFIQEKMICLRGPNSTPCFIKLKDIILIKSEGHYIDYYFINGEKYRIRSNLSEIFEEYRKYDFIRINKQTIVNLRFVYVIDRGAKRVILNSNEELKLSRDYSAFVERSYVDYLRSRI